MKLDTEVHRYLGKEEMRVLTAIEMGQKNHELVPLPLIESIANFRRGGVMPFIRELHKFKLIYHDSRPYEGYRLTYSGYDCLALRALSERGVVASPGRRIGVGKESDVHICYLPETGDSAAPIDETDNPDVLDEDEDTLPLAVIKFHRLGRVSFRSVKTNRDYLGKRKNASWMYMARLAAAKEFHYAKLLFSMQFPVPKPIDLNRHCIVMSHVEGLTLYQLKSSDMEESDAELLLSNIYNILHRLGCVGLIHGDLNEFNLIVNMDNQSVHLIDFPQVVHMNHENAEFYFNRDVDGIKTFFQKKFGVGIAEEFIPTFERAREIFAKTNQAHKVSSFLDEEADSVESSPTVDV